MGTFHGFGIVVIALLAATPAASLSQHGLSPRTDDPAVLSRFDAAVAEYLKTHRFTDPIDLEALCLPEAATHAAALLDEPPAPREGDVFAADVSALIRRRIAALDLPTHAGPARVIRAAVGDQIVAGRSARLPRAMASTLPPLPGDLDYRLVGADLVLLDLRTYVVVDALRHWRTQ